MLYPADLLKEVIENLGATLVFTKVEVVFGGWKCYTTNTQWYYKGETVVLDGSKYKVLDFVINEYLTLSGSTSPLVKTYDLAAPTFKHGKLMQTKIEINLAQKQAGYYPIIWMIEQSPRGGASEIDTKFESIGSVRLFIMNISDYSSFTTGDHYTSVINPAANLVALLIQKIKEHKRTGKITTNTNLPHAKFTFDDGASDSDANNVLTAPLSGIELDINVPIKLDFNCIEKSTPT